MVRYFFWLLLAAHAAANAQIISPKYYSVLVSATVQRSPPAIRLEWPPDQYATSYTISRKAGSATAWTPIATLAGSTGQFVDNDITTGVGYEYQVLKTTTKGYQGSGYIYSGIDLPVVENRGKIILLVDSNWAAQLAPELRRLQFDLVGDGWTVLRYDIPRHTPVPSVKSTIKSAYLSDPANVKALFLFGRIPVPYSGDYAGDSHDNHRGAWPADVYYGDMDGVWTDAVVNRTTAEKFWNHNVPGDGKFDQSVLPSDVELQLGRVDLFNMTCFANKTPARDELTLLRQYLNKDHRFRHGQLPLPRRGLIIDNFGGDKEALASTGWRNFAPLFGAENITEIPWGTFFSTVSSQGHLWSYGTGGGSYYTCAGIGSSDDFALNDIRTVFTFFFGSYYGDWDNESNFLRAPLGSTTYTLTSAWGGRPHWFMHHMALGETIGFSTRLTQNNSGLGEYEPDNFGQREVHTALHGDPTLRLHPVIPPSDVNAAAADAGVTVSWIPSPDDSILGYRVYRANSEFGPYTRVSGAADIPGTTFNDPNGASTSIYMVRAIKWEASASGTYFNPSQGVFAAVQPSSAPSNVATFAGEDWTTRGSWKPKYGSGGFLIATHATNIPIGIQWHTSNAIAWAGARSSSGTPYLEKIPGPDRVVGSWYHPDFLTLTVNLPAGETHRIALYFADTNRKQRIDVLDAEGKVLDSRTIENFGNGVYLNWDLRGQVTFRITKLVGSNAVLCGIFFGSSGHTIPPAQPHPPANTFLGANTQTRGSWKGVFGSQGNRIVADPPQLPSVATLTASGAAEWIWSYATTDTRAAQRNSVDSRMATCWYSAGSFELDLNLTDGQPRKVSFYLLDWDGAGREQKIEVINPSTGATLLSQTTTNFGNGTYLSYNLHSRVIVRFTRIKGPNAVLSGIFFDPPPP